MMNAPVNPINQAMHPTQETPQMASYHYGVNAPVPPAAPAPMPSQNEPRQG